MSILSSVNVLKGTHSRTHSQSTPRTPTLTDIHTHRGHALEKVIFVINLVCHFGLLDNANAYAKNITHPHTHACTQKHTHTWTMGTSSIGQRERELSTTFLRLLLLFLSFLAIVYFRSSDEIKSISYSFDSSFFFKFLSSFLCGLCPESLKAAAQASAASNSELCALKKSPWRKDFFGSSWNPAWPSYDKFANSANLMNSF